MIPPTTTGELSEELECPLVGPEIGCGKLRASVDDRGKRNSREVVPLGDHLRAEENGPLGCLKLSQDLGMTIPLGRRLGIESEQLQVGKALLQLGLEALCTGAESRDLRALTVRTASSR
jgi:hypothetical protein